LLTAATSASVSWIWYTLIISFFLFKPYNPLSGFSQKKTTVIFEKRGAGGPL
jgi:hypothetical protein